MIGNNNKQKGVTMIELLTVILVFSIVSISLTGLFISGIKEQARMSQWIEILNNHSFAFDYMSRAIRMAQKDITGKCIPAKSNFQLVGGVISFLNYNDECQKFYLQDNMIWTEKSGVVLPLTSSNVNVQNLSFFIKGESQSDVYQPRVTFSAIFKTRSEDQKEFRVQTTVSQRELDIVY